MANSYLEFFGLASAPFESAGPRPLVLGTGPLRRAVEWAGAELAAGHLLLCVRGAKGVGKSSLASALPQMLDRRVALIPDPSVSWEEIEAAISEQFGLGDYILRPEALLAVPGARSEPPVIVVDRAESVSKKTMERFEALQRPAEDEGSPLVALVFVADEQRLTPRLRTLDVSYTLSPLQPREIRRYLEARVLNAGYEGDAVFPLETCQAIYDATGGVPRGVDLLCTTLMVEAARRGERTVQPELVIWSCGEADMPALKAPKRTERRRRSETPAAETTQSSDADLPGDFEATRTAATDPGLPGQRDTLGQNDEDSGLATPPDCAAAAEGGALEDRDEVANLEHEPAISHTDTPTAQEGELSEAHPWHVIAARWCAQSGWASSAMLSAAVLLLAGVVVLAAVGSRDPVAPATPPEPGAARPWEVARELPSAAETPGAPPAEAARGMGRSDANADPDALVDAGEPSGLDHAPVDLTRGSEPREPSVVLEGSTGASESLGSGAPAEVAETGSYPAAPARFERSVPVLEPVEPRPSGVAKTPARPAPGSSHDLVWPQSFLDAQRGAAATPGRPRLEIPRPELAGPTRASR